MAKETVNFAELRLSGGVDAMISELNEKYHKSFSDEVVMLIDTKGGSERAVWRRRKLKQWDFLGCLKLGDPLSKDAIEAIRQTGLFLYFPKEYREQCERSCKEANLDVRELSYFSLKV